MEVQQEGHVPGAISTMKKAVEGNFGVQHWLYRVVDHAS